MLNEVTDLVARARDEVDHAVGNAGSLSGLHQHAQVERRLRCGLDDHGAASNQRGGELDHDQRHGIVPGRDKCTDATRVALHLRVMTGAIRIGALVDVLHVIGQRGVVTQESGTVTTGESGLGDGRAVLTRDDVGQLFAARLKLIGELAHVLGPSVGTDVAPALTLEGAVRTLHGLIDVVGIGCGHSRPQLFGGGIGHVNERARTGLHPVAANKQVVGVHLERCHARCFLKNVEAQNAHGGVEFGFGHGGAGGRDHLAHHATREVAEHPLR